MPDARTRHPATTSGNPGTTGGHPATVRFNDRQLPWAAQLSVADLLAQQGEPADAVATALNGAFIARSQRAATLLQPGDQLTVFKAIVGG